MIWPRPFPLHHNASILQNSPDFVDNYLHLDQQPTVTSLCGDVTLHPVVGEAGEGKRTGWPHVETWTVEWLNDPAAKRPANIWPVAVILLIRRGRHVNNVSNKSIEWFGYTVQV